MSAALYVDLEGRRGSSKRKTRLAGLYIGAFREPGDPPVEASVELSSALPGRGRPNSLRAIDVAPQPRAAWNWRRLIPDFMGPPSFGRGEYAGLDPSIFHAGACED